MNDMIFADWFREALKKSRLSGTELAERSRVSKASMYFYLDGSRIPGPGAVQKICEALHVPLESLPTITRRPVGVPARKSHAAKVTQ